MLLNFTITQAGLNAAKAAKGNGLQLTITHAALGAGKFTPDANTAAMLDVREVAPVVAVTTLTPDSFKVTARFYSSAYAGALYNAGEIGFWAGHPAQGGVLFAVASAPDANYVQRHSGAADFAPTFTVQLTGVPSGSVTVQADTGIAPAMALVAAHENAANPHTQYVRKTGDAMTGPLSVTAASASEAVKIKQSTHASPVLLLEPHNPDGRVAVNADSIELGAPGRGAAGMPFIDFHSSKDSPDYDVRLVATGGSSAGAGSGTLLVGAKEVIISGGGLSVEPSENQGLFLGRASFSWGGSTDYPTLYGGSADRYVVHVTPCITYVQNGVNGYTGAISGATMRMAANTSASAYWDMGIGASGVGADKFAIGREGSRLFTLTSGGLAEAPRWVGTSAPAVSNGMYAQGPFEAVTFEGEPASYGFHRHGYSGVALYHAGTGDQLLRLKLWTGQDYKVWHTGADGELIRFRGELASLDAANNVTGNGTYYVNRGASSNLLLQVGGVGGSTPSMQLLANYDDELYFRASRDSETNWDSEGFKRLLHQANYNAYAPTLTGGGASGEWNIRAYPRRADGAELDFIWYAQAGQPALLWGGNDGKNMYVYNPSNFSVKHAGTAGSADSAAFATRARGLRRRDADDDYNVQHHWTGTHWWLRGYIADAFHAEVRVGYADAAALAAAVSDAGSSSSHVVLPGSGLILQWGSVHIGDALAPENNARDVVFPVAFPNACLHASASIADNYNNINATVNVSINTPTKTGMRIKVQETSGATQNVTINYFVIGK